MAEKDPILSAPRRCLAARSNSSRFLTTSTSGGMAAELSAAVIREGGCVFGAAMDGTRVHHVRIEDLGQLERLQGSKYVQSDTEETMAEAVDIAASGRLVLFTGTPCQVAGLKGYLSLRVDRREARKHLLVADIVCHGIPSQKLFSAYLDWLAKKVGSDGSILDYRFRARPEEWGSYQYSFEYKAHGRVQKVFGRANDDPYLSSFLKGTIFQESCYVCPYAQKMRSGDFTFGDYWGIQKVHPGFYDSRGVSCVLINSKQAEDFFDTHVAPNVTWVESDFESIAAANHNLCAPTKEPLGSRELRQHVAALLADGHRDSVFDDLLKPPTTWKSVARKLVPEEAVMALRRRVRGL